jgi:ATP-dependent Clp protease adaptor protein ClpS
MFVHMSTQNEHRLEREPTPACESQERERNVERASVPPGPVGQGASLDQGGGATSTATRPAPVRPKPAVLPPWRVLLHNDDVNDMDYVVETIQQIVRVNRPTATRCMVEAHRKGVGQVTVTHRERAEFLADQLRSKRLTVTIEPER